jgi:class 3 adenylate cyclase
MQYRLDSEADTVLLEYIERRIRQPHFANARSVRNALDRARLRQASRLFERRGSVLTKEDLMTIAAADIRASRVFAEAQDKEDN